MHSRPLESRDEPGNATCIMEQLVREKAPVQGKIRRVYSRGHDAGQRPASECDNRRHGGWQSRWGADAHRDGVRRKLLPKQVLEEKAGCRRLAPKIHAEAYHRAPRTEGWKPRPWTRRWFPRSFHLGRAFVSGHVRSGPLERIASKRQTRQVGRLFY